MITVLSFPGTVAFTPRHPGGILFVGRSKFSDVRCIRRNGEQRQPADTIRTAVSKQASAKHVVPYKLNANLCLDKEHESKSFSEICKLPPGALQGLAAGKADEMLLALKIHTVEELGTWKYYNIAKAIHTLAACEEASGRGGSCNMNMNRALDKAYEKSAFREILSLPPSALQGLAGWVDGVLAYFGIKTIADLAKWKFAQRAEAIVIAAKYEAEDFSSR